MGRDVEITPELLLRAYAAGIFPMAERREADELLWIAPHVRGVIPLRGFHIPRRLARTIKTDRFEVRINTAFSDVIRACAASARGREQSWINAEIVSLYSGLHARGAAHSVECWRDGVLVGGLYGVTIGAAFFGESMFSRERDASKVALVHLVAHLIHGGFELLDAQFLTNHLSQFGAVGLQQADYLRVLEKAIGKNADFYRPASAGKSGNFSLAPASGDVGLTGAVEATVGAVWPGWFVLQLITQTS